MSRRPTNWRTVLVIFRRELRDQVRDRRTLFMVFVLPLLLYPLLGLGVLQLSAAFEAKPRLVVVVGAEHLPALPPLLDADRSGFDPALFNRPDEARRLRVQVVGADTPWLRSETTIRSAIQGGLADAVVSVPPDVKARIAATGTIDLPIRYDSSDEPSQMTYFRVREVVKQWNDAIVRSRLVRDHKPPGYTEPVAAAGVDVAPEGEAGGSIWGRLFPFLLMVMALTGAFYPAIDLCAGEKERGTMETLLLSPASRTEVVLGKFLTVMFASITTALLNLVSMGLTGMQIARQVTSLEGTRAAGRIATVMAPPQVSSYVWMMILLIPVAAFFSALCVALAVLARSMKEGQYYMTPLYIVSLPLILVTLAPEIQLDLTYCFIPITGAALLLKTLILGDYATARTFFAPVLVATLAYALIALRWAVDLFQREDVIFREAEVFDLRLWARQIVRDREPRPGPGSAVLLFALMAGLSFLVGLMAQGRMTLLGATLVSHAAAIVAPAVLLALALTSDPLGTLRLRRCRGADLVLAAGVALLFHPLAREVGHLVEVWFPVSAEKQALLRQMLEQIPNLGAGILVLAAMPALTEELAFRGYVLSGFGRAYRPATAIGLSAFLFGFLHAIISVPQQFLPATLLGLVLGLIAWRTGSLWPGSMFHLVHNSLAVAAPESLTGPGSPSWVGVVFRDPAHLRFHWPILIGATVLAGSLLVVLVRRHPPPDPAEAGPDLGSDRPAGF